MLAGAHRVGNGTVRTDTCVNGHSEVINGTPGVFLLHSEVVRGARGGVKRQDDEMVGWCLGQGCRGFGGGSLYRTVGGTGLLCSPEFGAVKIGWLRSGGSTT